MECDGRKGNGYGRWEYGFQVEKWDGIDDTYLAALHFDVQKRIFNSSSSWCFSQGKSHNNGLGLISLGFFEIFCIPLAISKSVS